MYNPYRGYQARFQQYNNLVPNNRNFNPVQIGVVPRPVYSNFNYVPVQQWNYQPSVNFPNATVSYPQQASDSNKRQYSFVNHGSYQQEEPFRKKLRPKPQKGNSSLNPSVSNSLPVSRKRSLPVSTEDVPTKRSMPVSMKDSLNDKITESIWKYFEDNRQSDENYMSKVSLRDALYVIFKDVFQYCGLYMVGSSMSGFATKTSDLDLCLMLSQEEINGKKEAVQILLAIQACLRKTKFIYRMQLIPARVPILKFEDYESYVECDLNINNSVGIRNTHLLRYYAAMDWRVRPLVLFMKKWARFHDINDASKKTISSYSLCLMMIHYLQYGCNPPVLDSIQKLYPDLFDYGDDIRNLKMNVKIEFKSRNAQSLGDLFLGFLQYYGRDFDYSNDVASVRLGCKIPYHIVLSTTPTADANMWKCLKVEEPFDRSNTARSCFDDKTFARVKRVFTRSSNILKKTRDVYKLFQSPF